MSFERILRSKQQVNSLSHSLLGRDAFEELHVTLPDPSNPEPAFIRATSWLYGLYFEAGRVSLTFLRRVGEAYSLLDRDVCDQHLAVVRCLRTELHHNLGVADSDRATRAAAELWRRKACGTAIPREGEQWRMCYGHLVDEATVFLERIERVVRRIEADGDGAAMHIQDWVRRLERSWPAATFDPLVDDAKCRLGRDAISTLEFRNRHVERWRKQLDLLDDGFAFTYEATRLIEKTLLDEDHFVLPLTGQDIMERLGISPGPLVGKYLAEARKHWELAPCGKEVLLDYLSELKLGA